MTNNHPLDKMKGMFSYLAEEDVKLYCNNEINSIKEYSGLSFNIKENRFYNKRNRYMSDSKYRINLILDNREHLIGYATTKRELRHFFNNLDNIIETLTRMKINTIELKNRRNY